MTEMRWFLPLSLAASWAKHFKATKLDITNDNLDKHYYVLSDYPKGLWLYYSHIPSLPEPSRNIMVLNKLHLEADSTQGHWDFKYTLSNAPAVITALLYRCIVKTRTSENFPRKKKNNPQIIHENGKSNISYCILVLGQ